MCDKKKIGIITYYYGTTNYGGILQAYALCRYLKDKGVCSEQISYDYDTKIIRRSWLYKIKDGIKKILYSNLRANDEKKALEKKEAFKKFDECFINSSKEIYTYESIKVRIPEYDLYICGSDQIWNPICMDANFFLDFVPNGKKKFAYAASIGADIISGTNSEVYRKMLADFALISVREDSAKAFLRKIGVKVEVVPDPIFLVTQEEWVDLIKDVDIKEDKYILTYFLGRSGILKRFSLELSYRHGLHIIDVSPFSYLKNERDVVDKRNVGPIEFLRYINDAEYILTDSFHCTAFSLLLKKKFLTEQKPMKMDTTANDRIFTLLNYFGLDRRFISYDTKEDLEEVIQESFQCDVDDYSNIGRDFIDKILSY